MKTKSDIIKEMTIDESKKRFESFDSKFCITLLFRNMNYNYNHNYNGFERKSIVEDFHELTNER